MSARFVVTPETDNSLQTAELVCLSPVPPHLSVGLHAILSTLQPIIQTELTMREY